MYGLKTWVYASFVEWIEADLNASLQSNARKGLDLRTMIREVQHRLPKRTLLFHHEDRIQVTF